LSPVSAARANGVAWLTGYAATVRSCLAILVTLGVALGGLGGCKDHDLERLEAVKRDVCACKDASCADQAMNRVPTAAIKSTPRTQALARDIMECRARIEAAERPNTDPDAEGSAAEPAPGSAAPAAGSAAPAAGSAAR
jgi:hypothetical protein